MKRFRFVLAALLAAMATTPHAQQARSGGDGASAPAPVLSPTAHPAWSRDLAQLWLAPEARARAVPQTGAEALTQAVRFIEGHEYNHALAVLSQPGLRQGPLAQYAAYYTGLVQLRLDHPADAQKIFQALRAEKPLGYLAEASAYGMAETALALQDPQQAVSIYEAIVKGKPSSMEDALLRLGRAYKAAGDSTKASETFMRLYDEFIVSDEAAQAAIELSILGTLQPLEADSRRYQSELKRAERLFSAKQYGPARAAFETLNKVAARDDRDLIQLRLAECDFQQGRFRVARDGVRPLIAKGEHQAEAMFYFAEASRALNDMATFLRVDQQIVQQFPADRWAEAAMDALGTHYVRTNDDDRADEIFRTMAERFPRGNYAERAGWKAGWRAYRDRKYADT
ncbi:MAG: tetratricopeptide repeat protein, partial [Acidobacteriaceae bacterium]|nr:tetratricopeptide repeat protein [Acidobacteriaceae bacterium]